MTFRPERLRGTRPGGVHLVTHDVLEEYVR